MVRSISKQIYGAKNLSVPSNVSGSCICILLVLQVLYVQNSMSLTLAIYDSLRHRWIVSLYRIQMMMLSRSKVASKMQDIQV